ncbi:hypothetical protein EUTSA_v10002758mg [Eutrema salsugineum]|uniref:Zinc knuckle CX2CX4HX4C domain-containing protein n=1 Tax=Eutrema salsugineum TaxID=72664 RepID=V4MWX6_EUTSA|nr:hypothetical protein EUTSA_v10002758mg [Eutrema salsugineum]
MDAYGHLIFTRFIHFDDQWEPILIRFRFEKFRKFCSTCGALTHEKTGCNFRLQPRNPIQAIPQLPPIQQEQ